MPSFRTEVLDQLHRMGSDVSQPHGFDFYLYLPSESAAQVAADKVRESDFTAEVTLGTKPGTWLCKATATITPATALLDDIGAFFAQTADVLHGEFDGWESDVIPI